MESRAGVEPAASGFARQRSVSAELPRQKWWIRRDFNPQPLACDTSALALSYEPINLVRKEGIEPSPPACRTSALPLSYSRMLHNGAAPPNRTEMSWASARCLDPLGQSGKSVENGGSYGNRTRFTAWTVQLRSKRITTHGLARRDRTGTSAFTARRAESTTQVPTHS